jgi:short-subunit dehydrogenase
MTTCGAPAARSVLVTGASSGIGRATAVGLASQGVDLTLLARSAEGLDAVGEQCLVAGAGRVDLVPADVRDAAAVAGSVEGRGLDGVVHSAAVMAYGRIEDTPPDVLASMLETNVIGSTLVAREAMKAFRRQGHGRLVLVSSVLAHLPVPLMGGYALSKAAVTALGEVLRAETRSDPRLDVTVVTPGAVNTPLDDQAASVLGQEGRPPPPVVSPERVAATIVDALRSPRACRRCFRRLGEHATPARPHAGAVPVRRTGRAGYPEVGASVPCSHRHRQRPRPGSCS